MADEETPSVETTTAPRNALLEQSAEERQAVEVAEREGRVIRRRSHQNENNEFGVYFEFGVMFKGTTRLFEEVRVTLIRDSAAIYTRKNGRANGRWKVYNGNGRARATAHIDALAAHGFDLRLAKADAREILYPVTPADIENITSGSTPPSVHPAATQFQNLYGNINALVDAEAVS